MGNPISLPSILMVGVGGCLPARLVSNDELAKTVDTSDE